MGFGEAILKCVVKCDLLRRAELESMRYFLVHWRRCGYVSPRGTRIVLTLPASLLFSGSACGADAAAKARAASDKAAKFGVVFSRAALADLARETEVRKFEIVPVFISPETKMTASL